MIIDLLPEVDFFVHQMNNETRKHRIIYSGTRPKPFENGKWVELHQDATCGPATAHFYFVNGLPQSAINVYKD